MRRAFILFFFLTLACAAGARADEPGFTPAPGFVLTRPNDSGEGLRLGAEFNYISRADFTNGLGSVSVARADVKADYSLFSLSLGVSHFLWESKANVRFSEGESRDPWDDLYDVTLQARLLNDTVGDHWHYWLNGELSSSFESDFPGAVGAGFDGGVAYDFWDGWMLGLSAKAVALSALSDALFGDVKFGAVVAVSQKSLRNTLRAAGLLPDLPEGKDSIGFSFYLTGAEKTYRLSPDSPVRRNGFLGMRRSAVGASLDYTLDEHWSFFVGPEYNYGRQYILYDSDGRQTSSHRLGDAWGGRAGFRFVF
ncbi:hypothetical protein [Pseudodesulfovibrio sp.]|uniref:hypothetical protein n=1 Tax=Pseudodesulfovibrio sp. TaxID=2035812 RepID=UPI00261CF3DF|nr:hypothetical protein [Pseudodesulfovibrio sp.]MDD3313077.1 hypothetical protein [Pseudodesulfovibrio sp.]